MPRNVKNPRAKPISIADLQSVADELKGYLKDVNSLIDTLKKEGPDTTIDVEGFKMVKNGMNSLSKFMGRCYAKVRF